MTEKKTSKKARHPYAVSIGQTFALMGNQTATHISDPEDGRIFSVVLIWETQGEGSPIAVPYKIQISAGKLGPMDSAEIDRRLGRARTKVDYPITSTLMRRIPYEKIIDASRAALIENNSFHTAQNIPLIHPIGREDLEKRVKQGRPFYRPDDFYQDIAQWYLEAKAHGGSVARKPALYIEKFVKSEVKHLAQHHRATQIRKWVAEARKRGYLESIERK